MTPYNIPFAGKLILSTLIGSTGLFAIIAAILLISQYLNYGTNPLMREYSYFLIFANILRLTEGLATVVLLIDYFSHTNILKRHKLEAAFILILWGGESVTGVVFNIWGTYVQVFQFTQAAESSFMMLIASVSVLYFAYRLITNRTIFERKTFLLLSAYFAFSTVYPSIGYVLDPQWRTNATTTLWFSLTTQSVTYGGACIFFLSSYLATRKGSSGVLRIPRYIVAILLLYGASQTFLVITELVKPPAFSYDVMGLTYFHGDVVILIQSVSLLLASLYIFKNSVSEVPKELGL